MSLAWIFLTLAVITTVSGIPRPQNNIDEAFKNVFGAPPTTTQAPSSTIPVDEDGNPTCICVPYYQCHMNGTIITDGSGIIDIRTNFNPCEGSIEVCCNKENKLDEYVSPRPRRRPLCGSRNVDGIEMKIVGSKNEARFGEFPWMVAITVNKGANVLYRCGGSLIQERVVLTAAHCVSESGDKSSNFIVRAGEWDVRTDLEILPYQQVNVQQIIAHEKFNPGNQHNNVALLILEEPFEFKSHIDISCLPRHDDVVLNSNCFVSGWGKDKFDNTSTYQTVLKKVELPIIESNECQLQLRKTRLGRHFVLDRSFICAGGNGQDACTGDGGSPLVCPIPNSSDRYQQVGIVSWGIGCGDHPGVYTNVAMFKDWIDMKLRDLNIPVEYNYI